MKFCQLRAIRFLRLFVVAGALLLSAGCAEEPVSNYTAQHPVGGKQELPTPPPMNAPFLEKMAKSESTASDMRILGAAIPEKGTTYYVKVLGPAELLAKHEAEFDAFLASLKFTNDPMKPMSWTAPESWKPGKGNQFSIAAFALPSEGRPVEVTISPVGGSLMDNLNRWRGQVSLGSTDESKLGEMSKEIQIDGRKAFRIDLKSPVRKEGTTVVEGATPKVPVKQPEGNGPAPTTRLLGAVIPDGNSNLYVKLIGPIEILTKHEAEFDEFLLSLKLTGQASNPLTWTAPKSWKPGRGNQFSLAAFALPVEGKTIELTISSVGGSLMDNLNRWRGQVGLGPINETGLSEMSKQFEVSGRKAFRIDLKGTGSGGMTPPFMKK
jgi:hypothetical protein